MFDFAISKWPNYKIVIKIHPDVINSSKKGCFEKTVYSKKNVIIISEKGQINQLIKCSKAVCVGDGLQNDLKTPADETVPDFLAHRLDIMANCYGLWAWDEEEEEEE